MRQTVTVISASGGQATVAYDRPTACHGDCSKCAGGCGSMAAKERVIVQAANPIGAGTGDRVIIEAASAQVFSAIFLVYALPVLLFFLGYFGGERLLGTGIVPGIAGFCAGLLTAVLVSRRQSKTGSEIKFQIVSYAESRSGI